MNNLKEMKLADYYRSICECRTGDPVRRLKMVDGSKGKQGSRWPSVSAVVAMLGVLCTGDIERGLNLREVFKPLGLEGDKRAENYTFGSEAVFVREAGKGKPCRLDYDRVLEGCTTDITMEQFLLHLYGFVIPERRQLFRWTAREHFGVRIPVDTKVA